MVTARGQQTREKILDAAERLFGERGVDGPSLREIRLAAGQRNSSALQFHFGDRDGLLRALTERHHPHVGAIQQQLYEDLVGGERQHDPAALVEVLVRPYIEYLRAGPSARAWVRIAAACSTRPDAGWGDFVNHAPIAALEAGTALHDHLARSMPREVAVERIMTVSQAALHLCADRARLEDHPPDEVRRTPLPFDVWSANVIDMAIGAMLAPVRSTSPADAGNLSGHPL